MRSLQQKLQSTIKKRKITVLEFTTQSRVSQNVYQRFMAGKRIKPDSSQRIQRWIEGGVSLIHSSYLQKLLTLALSRIHSATKDNRSV